MGAHMQFGWPPSPSLDHYRLTLDRSLEGGSLTSDVASNVGIHLHGRGTDWRNG